MPVEIKVRNFFSSRVGVQKKSRTPHLTKSFFPSAYPPRPVLPVRPSAIITLSPSPSFSGGGRLQHVLVFSRGSCSGQAARATSTRSGRMCGGSRGRG